MASRRPIQGHERQYFQVNLVISTTNNMRVEGDLVTHLTEVLDSIGLMPCGCQAKKNEEQTSWMGNILSDIVIFKLRYQCNNQLPINTIPSSLKVILVIRKAGCCDETFSLDFIGKTTRINSIDESRMFLSSMEFNLNFEFEYK